MPATTRLLVSIGVILPGLTALHTNRVAAAVVGYTTVNEPETLLTSVTIEHAGARRIYKPERLIGAQIVHFRSSGGVNVAHGGGATVDLPATLRRFLLDRRFDQWRPEPGSGGATA